jgi:hypothetical protein
VFLLGADDAKNERFFVNEADQAIGKEWWLRSPGMDNDRAADILTDGGVFYQDSVDGERGVRPALKINLSSSIFTSSSSKYEVLYGVKIKVRDSNTTEPIRGAVVAIENSSRDYYTGRDGFAVVEFKLGIGKHKIRVSTDDYGEKGIELDVKAGGGTFVVDM